MTERGFRPTRRGFLASAAGAALTTAAGLPVRAAAPGGMITRAIPSSGEPIPAIGMGTWVTFNVGDDERLRRDRLEILQLFLEHGGGMVDSSPMYGSAEAVIGWCRARLDDPRGLFSATKVWTPGFVDGQAQMAESRKLWGVERFDLMQVHNLVDWETHLPALFEDKAAGRVRYVGITTSHGSRHAEMARIMRSQPLDFVQFSYNIRNRAAETELLPLAAERGIAVIANRPFMHKQLFRLYADKPLPAWAAEFDARNWAQFFLKFVISHPAVTCAIPATSQLPHMAENIRALYGRLPDAAMRRRMVAYVENL